MLEFRTTILVPKSNIDKFMSVACDYLDNSGFTDLDYDASTINARKIWPSGSLSGTWATLAFFNSVKIHCNAGSAVITFGTARNFFVILFVGTALTLVWFSWMPLYARVFAGLFLSILSYGVSVPISILRAKAAFKMIAESSN